MTVVQTHAIMVDHVLILLMIFTVHVLWDMLVIHVKRILMIVQLMPASMVVLAKMVYKVSPVCATQDIQDCAAKWTLMNVLLTLVHLWALTNVHILITIIAACVGPDF